MLYILYSVDAGLIAQKTFSAICGFDTFFTSDFVIKNCIYNPISMIFSHSPSRCVPRPVLQC